MATVADFDISVVDDIDQETVEKNEAEFPTIQWNIGNPKLKKMGGIEYTGGFFISDANAPGDLSEHGWEKTTITHDSGEETDGYAARELTFAIVRNRQRWEVYDESSNQKSAFAWDDYDTAKETGRPSGRAHWLVLVKGMEDFGPFIITLHGTAGMKFFKRNDARSAVGRLDSVVVRAANDAVKKSGRRALMPRRAFWLTVGANRDGKGEPVFVEVGQGNATRMVVHPIAMGVPEKPAQVNLGEWFVGKELLSKLNALWDETVEWGAAWDNIEPGATVGDEKAAEETAEEPEDNDAVVEELGL